MVKRDYPSEFIYEIKQYIKYWSKQKDKSEIEKMEGLSHSILCLLDGVTNNDINIDRIARQCKCMMLHESFYER